MNTKGLEVLGTRRAVGSPWQETYYVFRCVENHTQEAYNFMTIKEITDDLKQSKSTWGCGCYLIHELQKVEVGAEEKEKADIFYDKNQRGG